jgi:hypothetical protein
MKSRGEETQDIQRTSIDQVVLCSFAWHQIIRLNQKDELYTRPLTFDVFKTFPHLATHSRNASPFAHSELTRDISPDYDWTYLQY